MRIENLNNFNQDAVEKSRKKAFAFMDTMAKKYDEVSFNCKQQSNSKDDIIQFDNIVKNGGKLQLENDYLYFVNLKKLQDNSNNQEKAQANSVEVASGGLDPIFNQFANKTNIRIELKEQLFCKVYSANGTTKDADVEDFIEKKSTEAGSNPFSKTSIGYEINKNNIVLGSLSDYYTNNTTSSLSIVRKNLNIGTKQALIGINQRQGVYLDRDFLQEIAYQVVNEQGLIDVAIDNFATEMKIRKIQELVYNQLFNSSKFTTAGTQYNYLKEVLYVDATNPVSLGEQTDNQFQETIKRLAAYVDAMKRYGANGSEIILALDTDTINALNQRLYFSVSDRTGNIGITDAQLLKNPTRMGQLLSVGITIIEVLGAVKNKFDTYYNDNLNISNNRVNFLYVKDLFQYVDLLDISVISNGALINGLSAIKNFGNYTMNSPLNGSVFVLTTHSPVFEGTSNYYDNHCLYSAKFDI